MTSDAERLAAANNIVAFHQKTVDELLKRAGEFGTLTTMEEIEAAGRLVTRVTAELNALTEERLTLTRPVDAHKTAIMGLVKPLLTKMEEARDHLKGSLDEYRRAEQARLDAEAAEREAALRRALLDGDTAAIDSALEAQLASPARDRAWMPRGTGSGGRWYAEVTDLKALVQAAAVDDTLLKFLVPYMSLLHAEASRTKGQSTIPGVSFKKEEWATAGAGR